MKPVRVNNEAKRNEMRKITKETHTSPVIGLELLHKRTKINQYKRLHLNNQIHIYKGISKNLLNR